MVCLSHIVVVIVAGSENLDFGIRAFAHHVGHTWVFNAGQRLDAPKPNHIILDTGAMTATRVRMRPVANSLSWSQQRDVITLA